jgi:acyl-homoserine lactone acylase PvdQ
MLLLIGVSAPTASATAADYADTALNIIPSGQYGSLPVPDGADRQAKMYDRLTPLFDQVTGADLTRFFKSERFGVDNAGPGTPESVPYPGVTIVRDTYNVPHVTATTYDGGIWAAGWIVAEDRGLLLQQARNNARVAAIDAPGLSALSLIAGLQNFQPSAQTEAEIAKQTQVLQNAGPEGQAVLEDIDTFISGINDYLDLNSPSTPDWTRNDVYAVNALKGQFVGEGGGDEARRSQFLAGLQQRLGRYRGKSVFNDLRQFKNPESPTSVDRVFEYGDIPDRPKGSVILDPGSYQPTPSVEASSVPEATPAESGQASNVLMIDADHSRTGYPLMVGGPQIGYFYPGLTYEIDMNAPGLEWRGATSAPFPGYMLIGRGPDFATTLTSSSGDIIDQYVERLCGGSSEKYIYRGECRPMGHFNAGTLNGDPVEFLTTVHGPVEGYAKVKGSRVAISSKRSSYGRDVLDQLFFRRLSNGQVHDPQSFFRAAAKTPQTFNSFYVDHEHIAQFTSGRLPIRPRSLDPGLPTLGTGQYEWQGFLGDSKHIQGMDPRDGTIVNWNNISAHGFGASDENWGGNGSVARVDLLDHNLRRLKDGNGKWGLVSVTAAMNAGATQDVRAIDTVPLLRALLPPSQVSSDPRTAKMLSILTAWRQRGGSRLDRNLDGEIDHPGAAIMDTVWPKIADAFMRPQLGPQLDELDSLFDRFDQPPGGQYNGWYQYFDRDIRRLLGKPVARPLNQRYCGRGDLARCRSVIRSQFQAAAAELTTEQGTSDPAKWRADATGERISFVPGLLPYTMRYTNRPSGIQQVISFNGHR